MVQASQAFHDAVRDGKPQRALFLFDDYVFTNDDITGSVNFEEYFCGETDLTVGLTPSASISFTLLNDTGALNGFSGGEFTAWLGACVSESAYKAARRELCRVVTPGGNVLSGHSAAPYLRYNGEACGAVSAFPVHALIWRDDTLYAIGKSGQALAWTVDEPDEPERLPTWQQVLQAGTWGAVKDGFVYGQRALTRAHPMFTAVSASAIPSGAFWTARASLWASRNVGIRLDASGKTMTECRGGARRTFEYVALGIFRAERPARVKVRQIAVSGYDRMALFEKELDQGFAPTASKTPAAQMRELCEYIGVEWDGVFPLNGDTTVYSVPGTNGMTAKEYLSKLAEVAGSVARFDRDGVLRLDWLTESGETFDENRYSEFAPAEYTTTTVTKLQARNSTQDIGTIVGAGTETYILPMNPLVTGKTSILQGILDRISEVLEYAPATASLFTDWALRAGDWVTLIQGGESFAVPVMRMALRWTGTPKIDIEATGNEHRATLSAENREEYRTGFAIHEITNDFEKFRSFIQSPEGAASIIEQSATAIQIGASQIDLRGYTTVNNKFSIDTNGYFHATGGTIAGFVIEDAEYGENAHPARIRSSNGNVVLNSDGSLTCKSGTIGGFTITASQIKSEGNAPSLVLNSNGTAAFAGFTISSSDIRSAGDTPNIVLRGDGTAKIGDLTIYDGSATFDGTVYVANLVQKNSETISGGWLTGTSVSKGKLNTSVQTSLENGDAAKVSVGDLREVYGISDGHARISYIEGQHIYLYYSNAYRSLTVDPDTGFVYVYGIGSHE